MSKISRWRLGAILAVLSLWALPACQPRPLLGTAAAAPSASVAAPLSCATVDLSFRPLPDVVYRSRVEERKQVYTSTITFKASEGSWNAVEGSFVLEGPQAAGELGDLGSSQLLWQLDSDGKPLQAPETRGSGKYLQQMSLFQFRPFALPPKTSSCVGTEWTREWTRDGRSFSYHYRIIGLGDKVAQVQVEGSATSAVNRWDSEGRVEISLIDGFSGESHWHIRGPSAPKVNEYDRHVRIGR